MKPHLPLKNIRVLEMTEALAGPYCAMMLGDLGADVIKIERPEIGDQSRRWGPPFLKSESPYFLSVNRNKRSLELNIKKDEDIAFLHQLITSSDVFITNIPRMSSLINSRIDPKTLQTINPKLIYAAISGYGHSGPKANRSGYDIVAQGEAGLMALTGEPDGIPIRFPTPIADITAGLYTVMGIQAALYARDTVENGLGNFIDVSLVDAQTTYLANIGGTFFANGERPKRLGNLHPTVTPYQPLKTKDKDLIVAVGTERLWKRFCETLQIQDTIMTDPRFIKNPLRNEHREELIPILEKILTTREANYWIEAFAEKGIPAGPINFPDETLTDEHLIARGMIVELEHPLLGIIKSIGNPITMPENGPTYRRYPPLLGEHNEEIRAEISRKTIEETTNGYA
ncbi:MAG: CaiB/BaiF CoA transferase family protein [Candidatus Rariloculaceae bacterium]